jgi:hypothetical protein
MQHAAVFLHSRCTTTGCSTPLQLVVDLTLRKTVPVEFVVDRVAVRQILFAHTVVSHVSIFQLVLHSQISLSQTPYNCTNRKCYCITPTWYFTLAGWITFTLTLCLFVYLFLFRVSLLTYYVYILTAVE